MRIQTLRESALACCFIAFAISGCAEPAAPMPAAGDVVVPELVSPKSWPAGRLAAFSVQLRTHRPGGSAELLKDERIPRDCSPLATLTFWKDEQVLTTMEQLILAPDC